MTDIKTNKAVLEVENLGRDYRMGAILISVLRDVSLQVFAGETVAIVGASGAGKSTLLHIIGGLDQPTRGTVRFHERDIYALSGRQRTALRASHVGFVFQFYHLLPELDVLENVMLPAMNSSLGLFRFFHPADRNFEVGRAAACPSTPLRALSLSKGGAPSSPDRTASGKQRPYIKASSLLGSVGLAERAAHLPAELSGGEQQRAAVARALVNDPELILADEPTGNLDSATGAQVLNVLFTLVKERQRTLVMVTHNAEVAARCDRVLKLQDGLLSPA